MMPGRHPAALPFLLKKSLNSVIFQDRKRTFKIFARRPAYPLFCRACAFEVLNRHLPGI
jgi:hypothetical protein